jgi:hypothetical protein
MTRRGSGPALALSLALAACSAAPVAHTDAGMDAAAPDTGHECVSLGSCTSCGWCRCIQECFPDGGVGRCYPDTVPCVPDAGVDAGSEDAASDASDLDAAACGGLCQPCCAGDACRGGVCRGGWCYGGLMCDAG